MKAPHPVEGATLDEMLDGIIADDVAPRRPDLELRAEHRLLLAIVDQALADLHGTDEKLRADAAAWFFDEPDSSAGGFDLATVAAELGVEVRDLRRLARSERLGLNPQRAAMRRSWATNPRRVALRQEWAERRRAEQEERDEGRPPLAA
jgi:hypothetical protein